MKDLCLDSQRDRFGRRGGRGVSWPAQTGEALREKHVMILYRAPLISSLFCPSSCAVVIYYYSWQVYLIAFCWKTMRRMRMKMMTCHCQHPSPVGILPRMCLVVQLNAPAQQRRQWIVVALTCTFSPAISLQTSSIFHCRWCYLDTYGADNELCSVG